MKTKSLFALILVTPLVACSQASYEKRFFLFDTMLDVTLYEGNKDYLNDVGSMLRTFDALSDNYLERQVTNVYTINQTNEDVVISPELYNLLKISFSAKNEGANYFNPLCGSLSKKWKESLKNQQILDENTKNEEISKINNSDLIFKDNYTVQRIGGAEIDLGGIVKGYVLDEVYSYLQEKEITHYLINGGSSSILVGEKKNKTGLFNVGLKDLNNAYIQVKNCFVSASGVSSQGVKNGDVTYSHIVNPFTGDAVNENDAVIVISDKGYLGDVLSTSMMFNTVEEIKEIEQTQNVKTIVIKDNQITYSHKDLEVKYH